MFRMLALTLALFMVGCVTTIETPVSDTAFLQKAIERNDVGAVRNALNGRSFEKKGSILGRFFDSPSDRSWVQSKKAYAYNLLDIAITRLLPNGTPVAEQGCAPEVVKMLLDAGLPARPVDLSNAVRSTCINVADIVLEKTSKDDAISGANQFLDWMGKNIPNEDGQSQFVDEKFKVLNYYKPVLAWVVKKTMWFCAGDSNDSKSPGCLAQEKASKMSSVVEQHIAAYDSKKRSDSDARESIEKRYKMKFCSKPSLGTVLYEPFGGEVESNCLYILGGPFKVFQVVQGGILVNLVAPNPYMPDKIFFVKTARAYVDDSRVQTMYVHSIGTTQYNTVVGAKKTINAFQYLGDAEK